MGTTAVVVLLLLLVVGLLLVPYVVAQRRRMFAARAAEAAALGWQPTDPNPFLVGVAQRIYQRGRARRAIAGHFRGHVFHAFDFSYVRVRRRSVHFHSCHLIAVILPVPLPGLVLVKDNPIARAFGVADLELESGAFNDTFWVDCADGRYASAVLHPRLMEWMLAHPDLEWRIEGDALVTWGPGDYTIPQVTAKLEGLTGVVERLAPFVLTDYRLR